MDPDIQARCEPCQCCSTEYADVDHSGWLVCTGCALFLDRLTDPRAKGDTGPIGQRLHHSNMTKPSSPSKADAVPPDPKPPPPP
jgi:hypothetical protein